MKRLLPSFGPMAAGAVPGAAVGYYGPCSSGTCPLTSTWWRGALYVTAPGEVWATGGRTS